jgi:hypothetical protein
MLFIHEKERSGKNGKKDRKHMLLLVASCAVKRKCGKSHKFSIERQKRMIDICT